MKKRVKMFYFYIFCLALASDILIIILANKELSNVFGLGTILKIFQDVSE